MSETCVGIIVDLETKLAASEAARAALVEERDQWKAWAETVEGLIEHRCFVHDTIQPECESCETIVAIGESSESLQQARALLARADGGAL